MTKNEQEFRQLVQKVAPGGRLRRIWPLTGGISAQMTAFEIEGDDGHCRKMIKRCYGNGPFEPGLSAVAHEFKILHITQSLQLATPAPYYLDLSGEIFISPYLIIEYIEGQMCFTPTDLDYHIRQLAAHLAQIHGADYTNFDLSFLSERSQGCAELGWKRPMPRNPSLYEAHVRNRLVSLQPLPQRNPSTLLHGDFWPGNSLWQNNKLVAVIDWEDAAWGDPLIDLAKSRSEIVWIFGVAAMNSFTEHYLSLMSLDVTHLPYWDLCAALRFIRLFGDNLAEAGAYFVPYGRDDIGERTIRDSFNYFVDQALGQC